MYYTLPCLYKILTSQIAAPELPKLPESSSPKSPTPPPPIEKDGPPNSTSPSRVRPAPPPKEHRTSMLQYVQSSSDLPNGSALTQSPQPRKQRLFHNQLASIKQ